MKSTLLYFTLIFSLGFVQAQESAAVYLSFTSKYDSQFSSDEKDIEHSLFMSLRSWLSIYVDAVRGKGINQQEFIQTFHPRASISGDLGEEKGKLKPSAYADLLSNNTEEDVSYQVNKMKLAAIENSKDDKFLAYVNFNQGPSSGGREVEAFHGTIEMERINDNDFEIKWKTIKNGYWNAKEPSNTEHFIWTSTGINGYSPTPSSPNVDFASSWFSSLGYLWKQPLSSQGQWSLLIGGQIKYISSQVELSEGSTLEGRGSPNSLQLNFLSPSSEIQNRISAELHLGVDWRFGSSRDSRWGISALFTPRLGQFSFGYFQGLVEYTEIWDDRVLIRDVINCGLGTFGGEDAQEVTFSDRSFQIQPGFLLRPRWKSKPSNWGSLQIGLDAQFFPAMGEVKTPGPFLQPVRGIIETESTQLRYRGETLHQTLSEGRIEWYAGLHLAYSFPYTDQQQSKMSEYDDLFSQEQRSGYEGKAYLILNGDISDAEAAERIRQDLGPATQFVWVINTTQLTNVEIPTMKELLSIKVNNNRALERISFADLNQAIDEIEVANNENLNEFNVQSLKRMFNARFQNNDSLNQLEFPAIESIEGRFNVTENHHLDEIRFPSLKEMNGSFYFSNNDNLNDLAFPQLEVVHQDITVDQNSRLKRIEWKNLTRIDGSFYVSGNSVLEKFELAHLAEVSDNISVQNNNSLETFEWQNLGVIGGDFLITSNQTIKSIDVPLLNRVKGSLSLSFNPKMRKTRWPTLKTVEGDIIINSQDTLESLYFENLEDVKGNILFHNNPYLSEIYVPSLHTLGGAFELQGAAADSLSLPQLRLCGGIQIGSNVNLTHVDIPNLVEVKALTDKARDDIRRGLAIHQNSSLSQIHLPKLKEIHGEVEVTHNQELREVKLPELLFISRSTRLSDLTSFILWEAPKLNEVGGDLIVKSNDNLDVLRLPALTQLGGITEISFNSELRRIELPNLNSINGHFIASHNSLKPSTIDALLQTIVSAPPPKDARIRFNLQRPAASPSWKGLRASRELKRKGYDIVTD